MSDAGPTTHVCPRHKVETPLTCVTCGTPICQDCYVRTAVGLRCPKCGEGVTVKIGKRRLWPVAAGAVAVLAVVAVVLVASGGSDDGNEAIDTSPPSTTEGGAAPGYRLVSRPELGYSVEVPQQWQQAAGHNEQVTSYSEPRSTEGALMVTVTTTGQPLAEVANQIVSSLTADGGRDIVRTETRLGSVPAVQLNLLFPSTPVAGAPLATRTMYIAVHNGKSFSFVLSTTDPGGKDSVFRYMATKFTLL